MLPCLAERAATFLKSCDLSKDKKALTAEFARLNSGSISIFRKPGTSEKVVARFGSSVVDLFSGEKSAPQAKVMKVVASVAPSKKTAVAPAYKKEVASLGKWVYDEKDSVTDALVFPVSDILRYVVHAEGEQLYLYEENGLEEDSPPSDDMLVLSPNLGGEDSVKLSKWARRHPKFKSMPPAPLLSRLLKQANIRVKLETASKRREVSGSSGWELNDEDDHGSANLTLDITDSTKCVVYFNDQTDELMVDYQNVNTGDVDPIGLIPSDEGHARKLVNWMARHKGLEMPSPDQIKALYKKA